MGLAPIPRAGLGDAQTQQAQSLGRHMVTIPSLRALPSELSQGVELSLGVYHRLG